VTGVVDGLAHAPTSPLTLAVGLVAVVVGFGAWWTYFDFAGHRTPRQTRRATVQWHPLVRRRRPLQRRWRHTVRLTRCAPLGPWLGPTGQTLLRNCDAWARCRQNAAGERWLSRGRLDPGAMAAQRETMSELVAR